MGFIFKSLPLQIWGNHHFSGREKKKSNKLPVFVEFNDQFQLKLSTASEITQPCEPSYLLHGSPPRLVSLICSTAISNHGELLCLDSFTWFDIANKAFKSAEDLKMTQEL